MFDILIYLFEMYVYNESNISVDYISVVRDLSDIGFQRKDIYSALHWLKNLSCYKKNIIPSIKLSSEQISTRIYTKKESLRLNSDCRGFILFLEKLEILTLNTREIIIEKIMALDIDELHLEDLKWIILIILFNVPGCELVCQKFEKALFDSEEKLIH